MDLPTAKLDKDAAMKLWKTEHSEYAKEQIILANAGMVGIILKSMGLSALDDDLYSVGIIGLIKAINTFDSDKNFQFSTYANSVIRNEILMTFRKKRVDISFSLDDTAKLDNGEEVPYAEMISSGKQFEEEIIVKVYLEEMLSKLSNRDRKIITLYYVYGKTQREIAFITGLSQSIISRIIRGVQKKYGS